MQTTTTPRLISLLICLTGWVTASGETPWLTFPLGKNYRSGCFLPAVVAPEPHGDAPVFYGTGIVRVRFTGRNQASRVVAIPVTGQPAAELAGPSVAATPLEQP